MIKQSRHSPEAENAAKAALKRIRRPLTDILQLELIRMTNWDVFDQNGECAARNITKAFLNSPAVQAELERIIHAEIVKETLEHNQWMRKIGESGYNLGPLDNHPDVAHLVPHGMQSPPSYPEYGFPDNPWANVAIRAYGETERPLSRGPLDTEVPNNVIQFGASTLTGDRDPQPQSNDTEADQRLDTRTSANPEDPTTITHPSATDLPSHMTDWGITDTPPSTANGEKTHPAN